MQWRRIGLTSAILAAVTLVVAFPVVLLALMAVTAAGLIVYLAWLLAGRLLSGFHKRGNHPRDRFPPY